MNKIKPSRLWAWAVFISAGSLLLAFDLWVKHWAAVNMRGQPPRVLIDGFLGLTYHENPGAAFGMLAGFGWGRWFLTIFNSLVLLGIIWYYNRLPLERRYWFMRVPLILMFVGGLGNLVDRVHLGVVRDMLEFLFMNFAIFNMADVYITSGTVALMFVCLFIVKDFPFP